jgi:hypothetical protein
MLESVSTYGWYGGSEDRLPQVGTYGWFDPGPVVPIVSPVFVTDVFQITRLVRYDFDGC